MLARHLALLALLLQGCSFVLPAIISTRNAAPAFAAPHTSLFRTSPCIPKAASPRSRRVGALAMCADGEECGCEGIGAEGGRRAVLQSAAQLVKMLLGGLLFPGLATAEEGPPPEVTGRRRRGASPFGYTEVQERLVGNILKQDPGGFLFSEVPFKTDTEFPDWMAGEWLVRSTIDEVSFPLGKKYKPVEGGLCVGMKELWSPMGPCFLPDGKAEEGREVYYKFRFNRDLSGVHRDHALNFANIVEGYGPGYAATGVQYNRKQKVLSAELKTPQSMDRDTALQIRKIRGFGTARCQWCPTFVCWDLLESVVSSKLNREKQVRRFEIISSYHMLESNDDDDEDEGAYGDTIEALQRIACYLGPSDEWYEETKGCAVALIDLKLLMRKVVLDETFP